MVCSNRARPVLHDAPGKLTKALHLMTAREQQVEMSAITLRKGPLFTATLL
jgi:hypothetical protein